MDLSSHSSIWNLDRPGSSDLMAGASNTNISESSRSTAEFSSNLKGYICNMPSHLFQPTFHSCSSNYQIYYQSHSLDDGPHSHSNEQPRATSPTTSNAVCINLAREAERQALLGEVKMAIQLLESAVHMGTDNLRLLCSIYCQLGSYYSHLGDHNQALKFYRLDFMLSRQIGDANEEARAISNLGNTLKNLGIFKESILCCSCYLDNARQVGNKTLESRALYSLGNVYHSQAKYLAKLPKQTPSSSSDSGPNVFGPGQYSDEVRNSLLQATTYYEEHLALVEAEEDKPAQGRVCGNLGNTHYMLGNFQLAIKYFNRRLMIVKEFGDKLAERRVHCSLGYACTYLGDYNMALQHFLDALRLALQLGDPSQEAQAYFNVGATYALQMNFHQAVIFYERHLAIAKKLNDIVGEARVGASLCKFYSEMNRWDKALLHGERSLHLFRQFRDKVGEATTEALLDDIRKSMGDGFESAKSPHESTPSLHSWDSIEERVVNVNADSQSPIIGRTRTLTNDPDANDDAFFDMLSRCQSRRMDEQRCSFHQIEESEGMLDYVPPPTGSRNNIATDGHSLVLTPAQDAFLDRLAGVQGSRMNDQRASLSLASTFPGLRYSERIVNQLREDAIHDGGERLLPFGMELPGSNVSNPTPFDLDESFLERLMRLQCTRINDQRSSLPEPSINGRRVAPAGSINHNEAHQVSELRESPVENSQNQSNIPHGVSSVSSTTVPEDDIFTHIMRLQSSRLDEQRCNLPPPISKESRSRTQRQDSKKGTKHRLIAISNSTGLVPSSFLKRGKSQT